MDRIDQRKNKGNVDFSDVNRHQQLWLKYSIKSANGHQNIKNTTKIKTINENLKGFKKIDGHNKVLIKQHDVKNGENVVLVKLKNDPENKIRCALIHDTDETVKVSNNLIDVEDIIKEDPQMEEKLQGL